MARSFKFKDKTISIGDSVVVTYKLKEGNKERQQKYSGIVIKVKGDSDQTRLFTTRKLSRSGIGVERIIPVASPFLIDVKVSKKGNARRAKIYFIRNLSEQEIRHKLYR